MIKIIAGLPGQGKTCAIVKRIIDRGTPVLCNFEVNMKNAHLIRKTDVFTYAEKDEYLRKPLDINWDYWKKMQKELGKFEIYIDEAHRSSGSRKSMSTQNTMMNEIISEVRKVLQDQEDHHIHFISQAVYFVDKHIRELADTIILCKKVTFPRTLVNTKVLDDDSDDLVVKKLPATKIWQHIFKSNIANSAMQNFNVWCLNNKLYRRLKYASIPIWANPYYKYYRYTKMVGENRDVL